MSNKIVATPDGKQYVKSNGHDVIHSFPSRTLITGATRAGKTVLLANLLGSTSPPMLRGFFDIILCFSPHALDDDDYKLIQDTNPEVHLFDEWDPKIIKSLFRQQKQNMKQQPNYKKQQRACVCIDDFSQNKNVMNSAILRKLVFSGRHANISLFVLSQYYRSVRPEIRTNCDSLFTFLLQNKELKKLADEHNRMPFTEKDILHMFSKLGAYEFLRICHKVGPQRMYSKNFDSYFVKGADEEKENPEPDNN